MSPYLLLMTIPSTVPRIEMKRQGRRPQVWGMGVQMMMILCVTAGSGSADAAVSTAAEICPPTMNPCVISRAIDVAAGSTLDFGRRGVEIVAGGSLSIGDGAVTVQCGKFHTTVAGRRVIDARASVPGGGTAGGDFSLKVAGQCSGDATRSCFHHLECEFGVCQGSVCSKNGNLSCSNNSDCNFGPCLGDLATVDIDGRIRASADAPESVTILAAGKVTLRGQIMVGSTDADEDGGTLDVESTIGAVEVRAKLDVSGGRLSQGGDILLTAATSAVITEDVVADGGEFDGGDIVVTAGEDVVITAAISATATSSDGYGGSIDVAAGRDLRIEAAGSTRTSGHMGGDGFSGDGGDQFLVAGRHFVIDPGAQIVANGAAPDGVGGIVDIVANGDVDVAGTIVARSRGSQGGGGIISIEGCGVTIESAGFIWNAGEDGANAVIGHDMVVFASGSRMEADAANGKNTVTYGRAENPPVLAGTITPTAAVQLSDQPTPCATCGNGRLEVGETCDDGGVQAGDGCSVDCQLEGCIVDTPGYPQVSLCNDGLDCTTDTCDLQEVRCVHSVACDDAVDCTIDGCGSAGACANSPDDTSCDDSNVCTDDMCDLVAGCVFVPNTLPCDDGIACTSADTCSTGTCQGTSSCPLGLICDSWQDRCVVRGTTSTSTTTTLATDACGNGTLDTGEECDDGDPGWLPGEFCNGLCHVLSCGDPDDSATITASDALFVLRVAVGIAGCDVCVCNVDSSTGGSTVSASDALRLLRAAVRQPVQIVCPSCA